MIETKTISITEIEANAGQVEGLPRNPRFIRDERFYALQKSIQDAPEMLSLRELIVYPYNGKYIVIGGNMRFRACKSLGFAEMPCKVLDPSTPVAKLREYTIKDNVAFGQDDATALAEWDEEELSAWGCEDIDFSMVEFSDSAIEESQVKKKSNPEMASNITIVLPKEKAGLKADILAKLTEKLNKYNGIVIK